MVGNLEGSEKERLMTVIRKQRVEIKGLERRIKELEKEFRAARGAVEYYFNELDQLRTKNFAMVIDQETLFTDREKVRTEFLWPKSDNLKPPKTRYG